ncbi:hypothetical protein MWU75_10730 [Ornithinimicrobium sp. F0845]|uniref:hypothetical protein n=1 Tax=Ornithinimicrobium sp. F0845 TaxID=2926412 RepID=UPI001FF166D6|nr:hypothetical protein [Ornithinimicrobium sp. F0845]MCK0112615.1 hypothetical protein [Ornithinimicrobium sp. F0845]
MTDDNIFNLDARPAMPSLWDPEVANAALDAFVDEDDRMTGGLAFLFCDEEGKLLQPVLVADLPTPLRAADRWTALRWATGLCEMVGDDHAGPLGLILAVVREEGPVCDEDREWHQVALDACAEVGAPMLGMHLVTMDGVVALPAALRAA